MATAILVHGMPTTSRLWDGVIEHLDGSRRIVALDLPGFAEPPPTVPFTWSGTTGAACCPAGSHPYGQNCSGALPSVMAR
jgi:pimeloyl-ACP methyl ester carboxylesterase